MIKSRWTTQIIATATVLCLLCIGASPQSDSKSQHEPICATNTTTDATLCMIGPVQVRSLEPSFISRWFRASQTQYQLSEQPALVVVNSNGLSQNIPNPQKYLSQYTFPFLGSELVPNTSNLASIVAAIYNTDPTNTKCSNSDSDFAKKRVLKLDPGLCKKATLMDCLVSGSNFWERLFAGVTGNFSLAQRDQVQQQILLKDFPTSISYGPGGQIDFDPSSLFVTGTNWQSVLTALKGVRLDRNSFPGDGGEQEVNCFGIYFDPQHYQDNIGRYTRKYCTEEFAAPRLDARNRSRTLALIGAELIPKFQFKVTDQFDFVKNGGVLVAEPRLQRSLKNYTFTWDLRHVIPSTSDRVAAFKAYKAWAPPPKKTVAGTVKQPKVCVTVSDTVRGYVPVDDGFTADGCRSLAISAHAESFALACASASSVVIGSPNDLREASKSINLPDLNACNW